MNQRIWAFAVYSILFEAIIWGVFGYAVFILGHSGWWMALAAVISGAQLRPKHFGITDTR
jgi:hypothetical protein